MSVRFKDWVRERLSIDETRVYTAEEVLKYAKLAWLVSDTARRRTTRAEFGDPNDPAVYVTIEMNSDLVREEPEVAAKLFGEIGIDRAREALGLKRTGSLVEIPLERIERDPARDKEDRIADR